MKIILKACLLSTILLASALSYADEGTPACSTISDRTNARCYVEPDDYVMDIIAFRLRKDDGSFVEFPASSTSVDFADGAAGSDLSTWISNISIPSGVYTAISPIVSPVVHVRGESDVPGLGTQCRTSESGVAQDGNSAEVYDVDSTEGRMDLVYGTDEVEGQTDENIDFINGDGQQVVIDPTVDGFPLTVHDGDIITFRFAINPAQGLEFQFDGDGDCNSVSPGPVRVTLSSEISNP